MPYVTSVERIGIKKGLPAGLEPGLELKDGNDGLALLPEIQPITEVALLQAIRDRIKAAGTPDDLRQVYAGAGDASTSTG